jgi:hypothetical protein
MHEKKHSTTEQEVAAALIAPVKNDASVIDDATPDDAVEQETKRQAAKQAARNNPRAGPAGARRAPQPHAPQVMRRAMMGWRAGGR